MTPTVSGNAVALLESGVRYFPALEASIDAAEDRTRERLALAKEGMRFTGGMSLSF